VTDVLRARIDRLPEATRQVLTVAAVLGREFSTTLLQAVAPDPDRLDTQLAALKQLKLLHDQPQASEPALVFKHALTQEAAYEQLAASERTRLHEAAGRALEQLFAGRLDTVLDPLAHHYGLSMDHEKAVAYLTRVGDRASRNYAMAEAVTAFHAARQHVARLADPRERDRRRLDLLAREAMCLLHSGDFPACITLIRGAQEQIDRADDLTLRGSCYWLLSLAYSQLGRHHDTREAARFALEAAERAGDRRTAGRTQWVLSNDSYWAGRFQEGLDHARLGVAALEPTDDLLFLGHAWSGLGINAVALGRFPEALTAARRIQELATGIGDPALHCYAGWIEAWVHALRGDGEQAVAAGERAVDVAPTLLRRAIARMFLGLAHLTRGDAEAIAVLRQAVDELQELPMPPLQAWCTAYLAEAHLARGEAHAARALALQAEASARALGFGYGLGVALRALGHVELAGGALDKALATDTAALETFAAIEARYEIAGTHLSLATVTRALGRAEDAARHLTEARALFATLEVPRWVARADELGRSWSG
jgi:tetratricopeptide (TPR) repeat protein